MKDSAYDFFKRKNNECMELVNELEKGEEFRNMVARLKDRYGLEILNRAFAISYASYYGWGHGSEPQERFEFADNLSEICLDLSKREGLRGETNAQG